MKEVISTVFTQFVPHPQIVRKGFIFASGNDFNYAPPSSSTAPYFLKTLLISVPIPYPSQCKQEIVLVNLYSHKTIEIPDII